MGVVSSYLVIGALRILSLFWSVILISFLASGMSFFPEDESFFVIFFVLAISTRIEPVPSSQLTGNYEIVAFLAGRMRR